MRKIGFWGFPKKTHTTVNASSTASRVNDLVDACTALSSLMFMTLSVIQVANDVARLQSHLERDNGNG